MSTKKRPLMDDAEAGPSSSRGPRLEKMSVYFDSTDPNIEIDDIPPDLDHNPNVEIPEHDPGSPIDPVDLGIRHPAMAESSMLRPENFRPGMPTSRYYDRYKNSNYVRRNDMTKYCQVCRKKVFSRLRSLPTEHRLRRVWILRLNLDPERSADLWYREAFSDAAHCGEVCNIHFPVGTENLKSREVLPLDMRPDPENYTMVEDETFEFENLELECVFCGAKCLLKNMIPFVRARNKRYKWIEALAARNGHIKEVLTSRLRNGASRFLCDWHFSDADFEMNQYGEWRLKKDSLPNPELVESDRNPYRTYMVNHGETILTRPINRAERCRREEVMILKREIHHKMRADYRQTLINAQNRRFVLYEDDMDYNVDYEEDVPFDDSIHSSSQEPQEESAVELNGLSLPGRDTPSTSHCDQDTDVVCSDDSDDDFEAVTAESETARFCQFCNRMVNVNDVERAKELRLKTWPYDEIRHEKWLEILGWPTTLENNIRNNWSKRRIDALQNAGYHVFPMHICEKHLESKQLYERMDGWHMTYCVICDMDLMDPNLLIPFPTSRVDRQYWMKGLLSGSPRSKAMDQRWKWLRERLTRPKATRYRLCVYHFSLDAFLEKDECIEFNQSALPLSLNMSDYAVPRGPQGVMRCPLCDDWRQNEELTKIRQPCSQAERVLIVEMFLGDKSIMKRGVEELASQNCKICKAHIPQHLNDPYSVVAERLLVGQVQIQCVQCNQRHYGHQMIPVPVEAEKRKHWIEMLAKDSFLRDRLQRRMDIEGRHYLCMDHFHKNALRFIPGLGVWKRFFYLPLGVSQNDRQRLLDSNDDDYQPLLLGGIDDNGVAPEISYDDAMFLLGAVDEPSRRLGVRASVDKKKDIAHIKKENSGADDSSETRAIHVNDVPTSAHDLVPSDNIIVDEEIVI